MNIIPTLPWLPPVVLSVIILLGIGIGYWNGFRTSLYFFIWNIVGLAAAVFILHYMYDDLIGHVPSIDVGSINIKNVILSNKENIKPIIGVAYSFGALVGVNIIAFLLYWIVFPIRRFLKKQIKVNKKQGLKNYGIRWVGLGLGAASSLPIAVFASTISTITIENTNTFSKTISKLSSGLSFGQFKDTDNELQEIKAYIEIADNKDLQQAFTGIFGTDTTTLNSGKGFTNNQKNTLETVINGNLFSNLIKNKDLVDSIIGKSDLSKIDFSNTSNITPIINAPKINDFDKFADSIFHSEIIAKTGNTNATVKDIKSYLKTVLGQ